LRVTADGEPGELNALGAEKVIFPSNGKVTLSNPKKLDELLSLPELP
jgi:hypothetical protein